MPKKKTNKINRKPARKLSAFNRATKKLVKKKLKGKQTQRTSLWDLDRDGITFSALSKFMNCRERFRLSMVEGWSSKHISVALEFGNVFHLYLQAYENNIDPEDMISIGVNYVNSRAQKEDLDTETINELQRLIAVAHVTFIEYVKFWKENHSLVTSFYGGNAPKELYHYEKDFHYLGKEMQFAVEHTLPNGRLIKLTGKMDGVFRPAFNNKTLWLMETKTKGDIDEVGITSGLHKDLQTGIYMLSMQKVFNTQIHGVMYNVIRRTALRPRVNETSRQFADRVHEDIKSRPQWYFMRWQRTLDEHDIKDFINKTLNPILYQVTQWWDSVKKNPFDPSNVYDENGNVVGSNLHHFERPFGCYDGMTHNQRGDFFDIICHNNTQSFYRRQHPFPELVESEAEKAALQGIVEEAV
jgi:hypothetical protein